jgi:putative ABC transport system permease protein
MFQLFFKVALRNFSRNKLHTLINIIGLAIGLAASMLIFLYIHHEYRYDRFLSNRNRIYRLETDWAIMPTLPGHLISQESGIAEKVVRLLQVDYTVKWDNNPYTLENVVFADSTFFDIFNFDFIAGDPDNAITIQNSIVLTESAGKKIFGEKNPLGELIFLDNQYEFTISGIIKDPVEFHLPFNAITSLGSWREITYPQVLEQFDSWNYPTYILAKPGFSGTELTVEVNDILDKAGYTFTDFNLTSLNDLYFASPIQYEGITLHGNKQALNVLLSIAIFILIIAAINFINLTTANGMTRSKEIGVRKLVGSPRNYLFSQFIFETLLLIGAALLLAFGIIEFIKPVFYSVIGKVINIQILYSFKIISLIILISMVFGIISGLYPSLFLSSFKPVSVLKGKVLNLPKASMIREGMIVFQLTISIVLMISTFLILNQIKFMNHSNLGFNKEQIVYIPLNTSLKTQLKPFKEELEKFPEVKIASYSGFPMGREWSNWGGVTIDGISHGYKVNGVDADYFETLGIELIEGRNFSEDNPGDYNATYIVNETAVRDYQLGNPVGKIATGAGNGSRGTVIGVVKDFHYMSLHSRITPVLFYFDERPYRFISLKLQTTDYKNTLAKFEKLWYKMSPDYPFEYHFQDSSFEAQYESDQRFARLVGYFSILAIIVACLGIFGLIAFSVEQRTKEIGIRKSNGASVKRILVLLSKDFTKWVTIAFIIACPLAFLIMDNWSHNFTYATNLAWWVFAIAGCITYLTAILTVSWHCWRAANKNPIEALRYE